MILQTICSALMYGAFSIGIAWPLAARLKLEPAEQVATSVALSLLAIYVTAWIVYITALPTSFLWVIPGATVVSLLTGRRSFARALGDPEAQRLIIGQLIVTAWCLGWLALIINYSGGKLAGDWFGHWQRSLLFLYHWPREILFNGFDPLPSRPPLANIVTGAFMRVSTVDFAHYQLGSTVLSSLAFLPAALLARRFQRTLPGDVRFGTRSTEILVVICLLSPIFIQNATYAWTKLPAAFFVLIALYFFLRSKDADAPRCAAVLLGATLGAAILTHYSAGPYALLLALAWLFSARVGFRSLAWWRSTALAAASGTCVLATWFAWALGVYGPSGTFLSNTTVTDQAATLSVQTWVAVMNIRDSLVPHFVREIPVDYFSQASPWGFWRDWFFQLYQSNLYFAFGSVGGGAICAALWLRGRAGLSRAALFWTWFVIGIVVLGIATHAGRESNGLAHISLQPLVVLGLAVLAAHWPSLGRRWHNVLVGGMTLDFCLGIVLHFGSQNYAFDRWFNPGRSAAEIHRSYSIFAQLNSRAKGEVGWVFFGDGFAGYTMATACLLLGLMTIALVRASRSFNDTVADRNRGIPRTKS